MGKNKAKLAVTVAVEPKPESRNMAATQKINFLTLVSYLLFQTVFS